MAPDRPIIAELHCPADERILSWVRSVVVQTSLAHGFDEDTVHQIELCVDEACANVVEHAYPEPPDIPFPLVVRFERHPDSLCISVVDRGSGQARRGAVTSLEEYLTVKRYRGLGTYIMQRFMDKVEFSHSPGEGTCVSMVKFLEVERSGVSEGG